MGWNGSWNGEGLDFSGYKITGGDEASISYKITLYLLL